MDTPFHRLCDLFRQLGLPDEPAAVERFIVIHRARPTGVPICEAPYWSPAQAQFLREQMQADTDWAEVIDSLAVRLGA